MSAKEENNSSKRILENRATSVLSRDRFKISDSTIDEITFSRNESEVSLSQEDQDLQPLVSKLEKLKSDDGQDARLPSRSTVSSGGSSSVSLAPRWVYGTTLPPLRSSRDNTSSSASGLCLSEQGQVAVVQPEVIQNFLFPTTSSLQEKIINYRDSVNRILSQDTLSVKKGVKNPLLIITGPTYITDPNQAKACAQWVGGIIGKKFNNLSHSLIPENISKLYQRQDMKVPENILLSIRANLTKYNYDYNDPSFVRGLNSVMTFEVEQGIPICRALLCELAEICPIVGEASDTITPQYLSDLFCLGIVSSTLVESQLHRELVSGVSYTVGFNTSDSNLPFNKKTYSHRITSALDAMYASSQPHQFLSITKIGTVAVVGTIGNSDTFIILQLNDELQYEELENLINKIYDYSKLKMTTPKIMLDVGKVSYAEYDLKLNLLVKLLTHNENIKHKIIGVLIDSGDNYIPKGYSIDLIQKPSGFDNETNQYNDNNTTGDTSICENTEGVMNRQKLIELNNYFIKNRMYKKLPDKQAYHETLQDHTTGLGSPLKTLNEYYEYFINADRMICELEKLCKIRINSS